MTVDQIRKEADQLPDAQKGQLASDILASMKPPAYDVSDEEVIARVRELESGEVEDIRHNQRDPGYGVRRRTS